MDRSPTILRPRRGLDREFSRRSLLRGVAAGAGAAALTAAINPRAFAQGSTPVASPAAAASSRFELGSFSVTAVSDGSLTFPSPVFPLPPQQALLMDAPAEELEAALRESGYGGWLDSPETASVTLAITPLVIDTGTNVALVDTGLGSVEPFPGTGLLLASLAAAGIDRGDIDTVVFTHAHSDHVLGALDAAGALAFPNAHYVMAKGEHDFWTSDERLAQVFSDPAMADGASTGFRSVLPALQPKLELVDENAGAEVVPGLRLVPTYGHTPGHVSVVVASADEQLVITGDAFTHPLHVAYPDWNFVGDTLFGQGDTSRRGLLDRAAAEGMLVQSYHVPFPGLGRVVADGAAFRWEPVATE